MSKALGCMSCDCGHAYLPAVGHAIVAKRKVESKIYSNMIVGPVVDVWTNACRVVTNPRTEAEGDFRLYFNEWWFEYLHDSEDA